MNITSFPKPSFTVDVAVISFHDSAVKILLIQRKNEPYQGLWALPGGFVDLNETAEDGAARELLEETGISNMDFRLLCVASKPGRDPRGWTITSIFYGCTNYRNTEINAGDDAANAAWFSLDNLPDLAFDHSEIIQQVKHKLEQDARFFILDKTLLETEFRLSHFINLYVSVLGNKEDARIIVQRLKDLSVIANKSANSLFHFNENKYHEILRKGFLTESHLRY